MDDDRLSTREGIDTWYVGMVEEAVKEPLRRQLAVNPGLHSVKITLSYGMTLKGLGTTKAMLYELAGIRDPPNYVLIGDILQEMRGSG